MSSSISNCLAVISPSEAIVAVVVSSTTTGNGQQSQQPPLSITATSSTTTTTTTNIPTNGIQIAIWSMVTKTLQSTLRYYDPDNSKNQSNGGTGGFMKLMFLTESLLAAIWTDRIIVWDLNRGSVAYTINSSSGSTSSSTKQQQQQKDEVVLFVDAVVNTSTSNNNTTNTNDGLFSTTASSQSSSLLYVLVYHVGSTKYTIHEYNGRNGTILRKIKAGKISSSSSSNDNDNEDSNVGTTSSSSSSYNPLLARIQLTEMSKTSSHSHSVESFHHFVILSSYFGLRIYDHQNGTKLGKLSASKLKMITNNHYNNHMTPLIFTTCCCYGTNNSTINTTSHHDHHPTQTTTYAATASQGKLLLIQIQKQIIFNGSIIVPMSTSMSSSSGIGQVQMIQCTTSMGSSGSSTSQTHLILMVNNQYLYHVVIDHRSTTTTNDHGTYHVMNQMEIHIHANLNQCILFLMTATTTTTAIVPTVSLGIILTNSKNQYQLQTRVVTFPSPLSSSSLATSTKTKRNILQSVKVEIDWNDGTTTNNNMNQNNDEVHHHHASKKLKGTTTTMKPTALGPGQMGQEKKTITEIQPSSSLLNAASSATNTKTNHNNSIKNGTTTKNKNENIQMKLQQKQRWDALAGTLHDIQNYHEQMIQKKKKTCETIVLEYQFTVETLTQYIENAIRTNEKQDSSKSSFVSVLDSENPMYNVTMFDVIFTVNDRSILRAVVERTLSKKSIHRLLQQLYERLQDIVTITTTTTESSSNHIEAVVPNNSTAEQHEQRMNIDILCFWFKLLVRYTTMYRDRTNGRLIQQIQEYMNEQIMVQYPILLKFQGQLTV